MEFVARKLKENSAMIDVHIADTFLMFLQCPLFWGDGLKLKEHVLKEHKTFPVVKDGKRYTCRILEKGSLNYGIIAECYGATKQFYMDFTEMAYLRASRRYIMGRYHPPSLGKRYFEFDTFEEAIEWLKNNDFKILPRIHRKLRRGR